MGREVRLASHDFALMIELDAEFLADEFQRLGRMLIIGQQGLTIADLLHAGGVVVTLDPGFEQFLDLVELFVILVVQGVVVIVIFGAGDQLGQRLGAVLGQ